MTQLMTADETIDAALASGLIEEQDIPLRPSVFFPTHSPACHPNSGWRVENDMAVCHTCGRSDSIQKRGGFQITAGFDSLTAHVSLHEAKEQLYRVVLAICLEPDAAPMKERMAHWQHLSSAFWHYQHILWDEAKEQHYWSPKWEEQRKFSLGVINKKVAQPRAAGANDGLSLSDLGL